MKKIKNKGIGGVISAPPKLLYLLFRRGSVWHDSQYELIVTPNIIYLLFRRGSMWHDSQCSGQMSEEKEVATS